MSEELTGLDIYHRSEVVYSRLLKFSKRALAHFLSYHPTLVMYGSDEERKIALERIVTELKAWETPSKAERSNIRLDRQIKEFDALKANNWVPIKKRRRRKRARRTYKPFNTQQAHLNGTCGEGCPYCKQESAQ